MFGYVVADLNALSDEQKERYRSCYCGLCRKIGTEYGNVQRLTLNYDLTFLALLLSSLYEADEISSSGRCLVHPKSPHTYWQTDATVYAAAMSIALSYQKAKDDWKDERHVSAFFLMSALKKDAESVSKQYPRQWNAICTCLEDLSSLEAVNCQDADLCTNLFGKLMGELFVWKNDNWEPVLRDMGEALGRYIYLTDAVLDLPGDIKYGRYNVLQSRTDSVHAAMDYLPVLNMMIGECCCAFEKLPVLQDLDILRNILYSGVWVRFHNRKNKEHEYDR